MRGTLYFHNLARDFSDVSTETAGHAAGLLREIPKMPKCIWPNKSSKQQTKSVLQGMHNAYLRHVLYISGWELEPEVTADDLNGRRADFSIGLGAQRVLTEVEFGNTARLDSALFKFLEAHHRNEMGLAVFVLAMNSMAVETDSGVATFEVLTRRIACLPAEMVPYKMLVVGLEADSETTVLDWSRSKFVNPIDLSGNSDKAVLASAVEQYLRGVPLEEIGHPRGRAAMSEAVALHKAMLSPRNPLQAVLL